MKNLNPEQLFEKYKLTLAALALVVSLVIVYCVLSLVISDGIGIPQMMQRTITLNQEDVYGKLYGFEIRGNVLFTYGDHGFVIIDNIDTLGENIGRFSYVTVFVDRLSALGRNVRVRAREESDNFRDGYERRFRFVEGQNTVQLPNSYWSGIELRLGNLQHMSMIIDSITLSQFPILPNYFVLLFLLMAIVIGVLWYFIVFHKLGIWLWMHPALFLVAIIVLQALTVIYYVDQKSGYHVDEMLSLAQANGRISTRQVHTERGFVNNWHDSEYFRNFITVQPDQRFRNFPYIYRTISRNVHPPFYHFQLHAMSSLFPNTWNNWMGVAINLIWMSATSILLYKASMLLLKSPLLSLLPVAIWGFSSAGISYAVYFRMYATLAFFFTSLCYLGISIITKKTKANLKFCILLSLVFFFGWLTHHYFIVFFAFTSFMILIWLIYSKEYKQIRNCIIATISTLIAYLAFWPIAIQQLSSSDRGYQAINNFMQFTYGLYDNMRAYLGIINRYLFAGTIISVLITLFVIFILLFVFVKLMQQKNNKMQIIFSALKNINIDFTNVFLFSIIVLFLFIISVVVPSAQPRYISAIFPLVVLFFIVILYNVFCLINKHITIFFLIVLSAFIINADFQNDRVRYLYSSFPDFPLILNDFNEPPTLLVVADDDSGGAMARNILHYTYFSRTHIIRIRDNMFSADIFANVLNEVEYGEELFIYILGNVYSDEILGYIKENLLYITTESYYNLGTLRAYRVVW